MIQSIPNVITDPDILDHYREDASGLIGEPLGLIRYHNETELKDTVVYCNEKNIPVFPCGALTSNTGAPLAYQGINISSEKCKRIIEFDRENGFITCEPGIILGQMMEEIEQEGWFYPVNPTSKDECTVGGVVATNATGSWSYKYGQTKYYVTGIKVMLADGRVIRLGGHFRKDASAYNLLDLFVGSEGTLGIITEVTLRLIRKPRMVLTMLLNLPSLDKSVELVQELVKHRELQPRAIELFDERSLALIPDQMAEMHLSVAGRTLLMIEEEIEPEMEDKKLLTWIELLEKSGGDQAQSIIARDEKDRRRIHQLRHAIPETINTKMAVLKKDGMRKLGSDWAVPVSRLKEMLNHAEKECQSAGLAYMFFGHIGNGHPHLNILCQTPVEMTTGLAVARQIHARAIELGGTISAEHGIGLTKKELLPLQYNPEEIAFYKSIKHFLDPVGIMNPGKLFG